jgi:hypothetical protein
MGAVQTGHGQDRFDGLRVVLIPFFTLAAAGFMHYGAFWPFSGQFPGPGVRFVTLVAVAITIGTQVVARGGRIALMLTWTAIGSSVALGTLGLFSVGMFYLAAAILLILALIVSPNRSGLESRADWRLVIAWFFGYFVAFSLAFALS